MKQFTFPVLLSGLILAAASCVTASKKQGPVKFTVAGQLMETHSHCGGAAPTPDMVERGRTPHPVPHKTYYVKKGNANGRGTIIDSIVSDDAGNFRISLEAGTYCLVEQWKTKPYIVPSDNKYVTYDTACHRKLYMTCDYVLDVSKNMDKVNIVSHRSCAWNQPCQRYDGPLPPASRPPGRSGQPGHQE